jgi:MOSC domain-containing protein YiiM
MAGRVEHLHLAQAAGAPMARVAEAEAVAGAGLRGDRYADGAGYWRDARVSRDLTLVEGEVADEVGVPGELRRNVTTRDVRLNDLVGRTFWVGDVLCRGTELCEPCRHLEELTGKRLLRDLVHRGGLRARILSGGVLRVEDPIEMAEELDGVDGEPRRR